MNSCSQILSSIKTLLKYAKDVTYTFQFADTKQTGFVTTVNVDGFVNR